MIIRPARELRGEIRLPGDKSISHRAVMMAAIADSDTRIQNFATSRDCAATLSCVEALGVGAEFDGSDLVVRGVGKNGLRAPGGPLDCGNSGTTMRLLVGILAGQSFRSVLAGDESLSRRPMRRVVDPLGKMGVQIESNNGMPPLAIQGTPRLHSITYQLPVASAQIKSCILLAGLYAEGRTTVIESDPTRDHTERMLRWFGVDVETRTNIGGREISVTGDARLTARDIRIPADVSSAAFFLVAAACLGDSAIEIKNAGLNPTRRAILDVLQEAGAQLAISNEREQSNEPVGDISISGGLGADSKIVLRGGRIANLIDEIPIIAVLGTQLEKGIEIRDAAELRVKESDRIAAVAENLRRMSADIEEFDDGIRVGSSRLRGARISSFGDHRIAMAFAIAGLLADGETEIEGAECAAVSFPGFFEVLENAIVYK